MKKIIILLMFLFVCNLSAQETQDYLYDGTDTVEELLIKHEQFRTEVRTEEVPDTCSREVPDGYDNVCNSVPNTQCETIPGQCRDEYREICHTPAPICRDVIREECENEPRQQCHNESRRECTNPSPVCHNVPREVCENVPRRECHTPSPTCRDVQNQVCSNGPETCSNEPREVCQPGERTCTRICNENSPRCMSCSAGPRVCHTENNRVCHPGRRECHMETSRECSPSSPVCTTTNERVCRTENDRQCHTPNPECRTVNEQVCNTTYERVCRNVRDQVCQNQSPECRTVSERVCDPDSESCSTTYEEVCENVPRTRTEEYACTRTIEHEESVLDHLLITKATLNFTPNPNLQNIREMFIFKRENNNPKMDIESSGQFLIFGKIQVGPIVMISEKEKEQKLIYQIELEPMEKYKSFQTAGVQKLTFNRTQFSLGFNEVRMPIVTVKVSLFKLKKILNRVVETILKDKVYNLKDLKPTIANGIVTVTVPFEKELAAGRYKIEASVELKTDASVLNSKILKAPVINSSKIISL